MGRFFGAEEYDTPTVSPLRTGETMAINPLEKQLFGFTKRPAKNSLQEEMGKLNLQYFDIYRRDNNEMIDLYTRQNLSREGDEETNLNELLETFIKTDEYKALETQQEKRFALVEKGQGIIGTAREQAKTELTGESEITEDLSPVKIQKWQKLSGNARKTLNTKYRRLMLEGKMEFVDGKKYDDIKSVDTYLSRLIEDETGDIMPLYQWAMENATELELK